MNLGNYDPDEEEEEEQEQEEEYQDSGDSTYEEQQAIDNGNGDETAD